VKIFSAQIRGRVGEWFLGEPSGWGRHDSGRRWGWHGRCGCTGFTCPHQHGTVLVDGALLDRNELGLEILEETIVKGKLALQGAIGDPAVLLQHGYRLAEDFVERHGGSSAYRIAPRRASTAAYHTRTPQGAPCRAGDSEG
jgi:hypothetical protein